MGGSLIFISSFNGGIIVLNSLDTFQHQFPNYPPLSPSSLIGNVLDLILEYSSSLGKETWEFFIDTIYIHSSFLQFLSKMGRIPTSILDFFSFERDTSFLLTLDHVLSSKTTIIAIDHTSWGGYPYLYIPPMGEICIYCIIVMDVALGRYWSWELHTSLLLSLHHLHCMSFLEKGFLPTGLSTLLWFWDISFISFKFVSGP